MWYDQNGIPQPRFMYEVVVEHGELDCTEAYKQILTSKHEQGAIAAYPRQLIHELNLAEEVAAKEEV
jgi:hypothetical protein